ncbi:MAG TPA: hypothetical protein VIK24_03225, partial [Pyrinomonadaceae bacterium]
FGIGQAFTWIAEELSRQYSLGYYPRTTAQNGQRRAIKVKVNTPELIAKSRDSYIYTERKPIQGQPAEKTEAPAKQPYISDSNKRIRDTVNTRQASPQ